MLIASSALLPLFSLLYVQCETNFSCLCGTTFLLHYTEHLHDSKDSYKNICWINSRRELTVDRSIVIASVIVTKCNVTFRSFNIFFPLALDNFISHVVSHQRM